MTVSLDKDSPELAREYDNIGNSQFEDGLRLLESLDIKSGMNVLDIGCGTGRLGRTICGRIGTAGNYSGIEPMPERLKIAREKNTFEHALFYQGTAEDLSAIPDSSIDRIVINWVFHWIENKPAALSEIYRVLKEDGKIGITLTPKELSAFSGLSPFMRRIMQHEPYKSSSEFYNSSRQKNWIETSDLIRLLTDSGLSVEDFHTVEIIRQYACANDALRHMQASTFGNFMSHVPDGLRGSFSEELVREIEKTRNADGVSFHAYVLFAVIRKKLS